jgi:hypothetical protein
MANEKMEFSQLLALIEEYVNNNNNFIKNSQHHFVNPYSAELCEAIRKTYAETKDTIGWTVGSKKAVGLLEQYEDCKEIFKNEHEKPTEDPEKIQKIRALLSLSQETINELNKEIKEYSVLTPAAKRAALPLIAFLYLVAAVLVGVFALVVGLIALVGGGLYVVFSEPTDYQKPSSAAILDKNDNPIKMVANFIKGLFANAMNASKEFFKGAEEPAMLVELRDKISEIHAYAQTRYVEKEVPRFFSKPNELDRLERNDSNLSPKKS